MNVSQPFIERDGVDSLGNNGSLQRLHRSVQNRTERGGLGGGEFTQGLTETPGLEDKLAGIGKRAGVVTNEPEAIVENHSARRRDLTGHLRAGAARTRRRLAVHDASAMRSLRTQTLVAKNSRIMAG